MFVLDEADRMLDMGFEEDIKKIMRYLKAPRIQNLLFTATWPKEVQMVADQILKDPVDIKIGNPDAFVCNTDIK